MNIQRKLSTKIVVKSFKEADIYRNNLMSSLFGAILPQAGINLNKLTDAVSIPGVNLADPSYICFINANSKELSQHDFFVEISKSSDGVICRVDLHLRNFISLNDDFIQKSLLLMTRLKEDAITILMNRHLNQAHSTSKKNNNKGVIK